eukprot:763858-Hanusia_phi.AAC.4
MTGGEREGEGGEGEESAWKMPARVERVRNMQFRCARRRRGLPERIKRFDRKSGAGCGNLGKRNKRLAEDSGECDSIAECYRTQDTLQSTVRKQSNRDEMAEPRVQVRGLINGERQQRADSD